MDFFSLKGHKTLKASQTKRQKDTHTSYILKENNKVKIQHNITDYNQYTLRCYAIPDITLKEEQELLDTYTLQNLHDLFSKVYEDFFVLSTLMKNFDERKDVGGEFIRITGHHLFHSLELFDKLCSIIANFEETRISPIHD